MNTENHSQTAAFLWSIADLLRGDFKQSQYGRIILPFTLLRRMECVLAPTKDAVIYESYAQEGRRTPYVKCTCCALLASSSSTPHR